jgi:hypothetical protein
MNIGCKMMDAWNRSWIWMVTLVRKQTWRIASSYHHNRKLFPRALRRLKLPSQSEPFFILTGSMPQIGHESWGGYLILTNGNFQVGKWCHTMRWMVFPWYFSHCITLFFIQWIGLGKNLNPKPSIFPWNMGLSGFNFPLNQSIFLHITDPRCLCE